MTNRPRRAIRGQRLQHETEKVIDRSTARMDTWIFAMQKQSNGSVLIRRKFRGENQINERAIDESGKLEIVNKNRKRLCENACPGKLPRHGAWTTCACVSFGSASFRRRPVATWCSWSCQRCCNDVGDAKFHDGVGNAVLSLLARFSAIWLRATT